jgi:hypothetical protein
MKRAHFSSARKSLRIFLVQSSTFRCLIRLFTNANVRLTQANTAKIPPFNFFSSSAAPVGNACKELGKEFLDFIAE